MDEFPWRALRLTPMGLAFLDEARSLLKARHEPAE